MGARGPRPKPIEAKVLQGTFRPDRAPKNPACPPVELPGAPAWLPAAAKREWNRVGALLLEARLVSKLDLGVLAIYCCALADMEWARREMAKPGGRVMKLKGGYRQVAPAVSIYQQATERLRQAAAELGLSPAARARVEAAPPDDDRPANPWDEL